MADTHRVQTHAAHYQPRTSDAARAMDGWPSMTDQSHTQQQLVRGAVGALKFFHHTLMLKSSRSEGGNRGGGGKAGDVIRSQSFPFLDVYWANFRCFLYRIHMRHGPGDPARGAACRVREPPPPRP